MKTGKKQFERRGLLALAIVSLFILFNSCSSSNTPPANQVFIQGKAFSPATLTVTAGTTVTWTNKDPFTHTVTSDGGFFDNENVTSGTTFSFMFMTPGTYPYHCNIHTFMHGTVVVK